MKVNTYDEVRAPDVPQLDKFVDVLLGSQPVEHVKRASGVSEVDTDGRILGKRSNEAPHLARIESGGRYESPRLKEARASPVWSAGRRAPV